MLPGIGPANQAISIDFIDAYALDPDDILATPAMPIGGSQPFALAFFCTMRDLEMAGTKFKHVAIDGDTMTVSIQLTVSKTAPEAPVGVPL